MSGLFPTTLNNQLINTTEKNNTEIKEQLSIYNGMNEVFDETRKIIDLMQNGEKIAVRDLIYQVRAKFNMMSVANVTNLVHIYLKKCKDVSVEVGRNGGVYKGGKPKRIDPRPRCKTCGQVVKPQNNKLEDLEQTTTQQ